MSKFLGKVASPPFLCVALAAIWTSGLLMGLVCNKRLAHQAVSPSVTFPCLPNEVHERPAGVGQVFRNAVMVSSHLGHGTGLYCRGLDPKGTDRVLVVTSAHVVEGVERVTLCHETGGQVTQQEGKVVHRAMDPDIALIEPVGELGPYSDCPLIELFDGLPTLGEPVWFVGLIDGHSLALETTIVSATSQYIGDQRFYGITGVTYPGSSGSCVFVQREGRLKLLGLVTCGRRGTMAPTWINTNDQIKAWLAGLK